MVKINGIPAENVGLEVGRFSLRKRARQNYEVINIPGKLTPHIVPLSSYTPVSIAIPADLFDYSRIDEVYKWLGTGKAVLIDERDPEKYRIGYCFEEVTVDCYNEEICSLAMNFICEPFLYKVDEEPVALKVGGSVVVVSEGVDTAPTFRIKVTAGSSAATPVQITIGTEYFSFIPTEAVVENGYEVTVDCEEKITYYTDQNGDKHIMSSSVSDYPSLKGYGANNTIFISGSITSAEIDPKTRWL